MAQTRGLRKAFAVPWMPRRRICGLRQPSAALGLPRSGTTYLMSLLNAHPDVICAGEHFNPHVSTGNAPTTYLDQMIAEPFEPFAFSPSGAAVYQLGPFGTAAKKLKAWDLKP